MNVTLKLPSCYTLVGIRNSSIFMNNCSAEAALKDLSRGLLIVTVLPIREHEIFLEKPRNSATVQDGPWNFRDSGTSIMM